MVSIESSLRQALSKDFQIAFSINLELTRYQTLPFFQSAAAKVQWSHSQEGGPLFWLPSFITFWKVLGTRNKIGAKTWLYLIRDLQK